MDDAGAGTLEAVRRCLGDALEGCERVGVAFSGGVDSSLLAKVCSEHAGVALLTVGFESSHDMEYSALAAPRLRLPHHARTISDGEFGQAYRLVDGVVPPGAVALLARELHRLPLRGGAGRRSGAGEGGGG